MSRAAARPDRRPSPEAGDRELDPASGQATPRQRPQGSGSPDDGRANREEMERPVRTDVADPQRGQLGQLEPGIEAITADHGKPPSRSSTSPTRF